MCSSLAALLQLFIWLIVIGAIVALVRLVLPLVLGWLGVAGSVIVQAINIILWAVVAIVAITFVFQLISCLLGMSGGIHIGR